MKITIGGEEKVIGNAAKKSQLVSKVYTKNPKEMKALLDSNIVESMTHAELVAVVKEIAIGLSLVLYDFKKEGKLE